MNMMPQDFEDKDTQAAWELLGRHESIEPSFGFTQRTVRRLHEQPARLRFWEWPVWRWAAAAGVAGLIVAGGLVYRQASRQHKTETALIVPQDWTDDYDVIAALDQLEKKDAL